MSFVACSRVVLCDVDQNALLWSGVDHLGVEWSNLDALLKNLTILY